MKISNKHLRSIIKEALLLEAPKVDLSPDNEKPPADEDKDLDIKTLGITVPPTLKKLLDPDVSPAKYADLDQIVDEGDNINHQALAIASFALSYTDMDETSATRVLAKAKELVPKMIKSKQNK